MKSKILYAAGIAILLSAFGQLSYAQDAAVKTRLTRLASLSFDAGVECALSQRWTLDFSVTYNPWTFPDNAKWKLLMAEPQLRFWPCQKFFGWFVGTYIHGGAFNIGNLPYGAFRDSRYEGWFAGGGLAAGYQWVLSRHFSLEAEAGAGFDYSRYDCYLCPVCGKKLASDMPNRYWGLTKANVSIVYFF